MHACALLMPWKPKPSASSRSLYAPKIDLNSLVSRLDRNGLLSLGLLSRSVSSMLGSHAHLGCEGRVRNPSTGLAWVDLLQHAVDLLEGETLGLWHEEEGEEDGDDAKGSPHEEDLGRQVRVLGIDEVWGDDCDDLRGNY